MTDVLVLNSSYEPLGVVTLRRAVRLLFAHKAEVLHDTGQHIHSEKIAFPLPSVLRLLYYITHRKKTVALTKKNVLLRDDYTCGYCGVKGGARMTVDHVVPKSRGGESSWKNLVASCETCNSRKRDRTPEEARMPLLRKPFQPSYIPWVVVRRNTVPGEWINYLSLYNVSIEQRL